MPRQNTGPKLVLYGPDTRRGAKKRAGFKNFVWYVVWSDRGVKRERRAGTSDREKAMQVLRQVTEEMTAVTAETPVSAVPRPSEVLIGDLLATYGEEHGVSVNDPVRLGVGRVAGAEIVALVEGQEAAVGAIKAGTHPHGAVADSEVDQRAAGEAKDRLRQVLPRGLFGGRS